MNASTSPVESPRRVGLLAGWGRYPIVVAQTLKRQGCFVCCLGVKDHADPVLESICDDFSWIGVAKLGQAIRYFRRHGISEATMCGKLHKMLIYEKWSWLKHLPDLRFVKTFYPHFVTAKKDLQDDTLMKAIVDAFAADGIVFAPPTEYVPDLLVGPGRLTPRGPSSTQLKDITFGWQIAKQMGGLDIGQTVCIKDRMVLAVEALEGTDACIRRAGTVCSTGGFSVVKVAKPQQDMRFDVPTVGLGTLESMASAGAIVLAIEAARTVVLDESQFLQYACHRKIAIVAESHDGSIQAAA